MRRRVLVFIQRAQHAQGIIAQSLPEHQEDGTVSYAAEFSFTDRNGKSHFVDAGVKTNPPEFEVGERVRVLYSASDPADAKIDSFAQLWFLPLLFAGLGIFFVLAGGLLVLWERRSKRQNVLASAKL